MPARDNVIAGPFTDVPIVEQPSITKKVKVPAKKKKPAPTPAPKEEGITLGKLFVGYLLLKALGIRL